MENELSDKLLDVRINNSNKNIIIPFIRNFSYFFSLVDRNISDALAQGLTLPKAVLSLGIIEFASGLSFCDI
jgi:hypothetical protein